jgi:hypothetical protein
MATNSDPAWLELYEIEEGKEPKRLRRYELPRMVEKEAVDDLRLRREWP